MILATSIAESSITLPGVTAVVDSGLARQPAFDARSDLWRLETVPISLASADQRAGRAGVCLLTALRSIRRIGCCISAALLWHGTRMLN